MATRFFGPHNRTGIRPATPFDLLQADGGILPPERIGEFAGGAAEEVSPGAMPTPLEFPDAPQAAPTPPSLVPGAGAGVSRGIDELNSLAPEDFSRSGGAIPTTIPRFATGTGVFEPLEADPRRREQGQAIPTFRSRLGLFQQQDDGSITLNGRPTKRSARSVWREFLRSRGIRPRIDARATRSPRAFRNTLDETNLLPQTPERDPQRSRFLQEAEEAERRRRITRGV